MGAIHSIVFGLATQYGPELVSVGDFSSSGAWTLGSGWAVDTGIGKAVKTAGGGSISQTNGSDFIDGEQYEVIYTIDNYSGGGGVYLSLVGTATTAGATRSANGTYTEVLTCPNTNFGQITIAINPTLGSELLQLDNVSIRRKFY